MQGRDTQGDNVVKHVSSIKWYRALESLLTSIMVCDYRTKYKDNNKLKCAREWAAELNIVENDPSGRKTKIHVQWWSRSVTSLTTCTTLLELVILSWKEDPSRTLNNRPRTSVTTTSSCVIHFRDNTPIIHQHNQTRLELRSLVFIWSRVQTLMIMTEMPPLIKMSSFHRNNHWSLRFNGQKQMKMQTQMIMLMRRLKLQHRYMERRWSANLLRHLSHPSWALRLLPNFALSQKNSIKKGKTQLQWRSKYGSYAWSKDKHQTKSPRRKIVPHYWRPQRVDACFGWADGKEIQGQDGSR